MSTRESIRGDISGGTRSSHSGKSGGARSSRGGVSGGTRRSTRSLNGETDEDGLSALPRLGPMGKKTTSQANDSTSTSQYTAPKIVNIAFEVASNSEDEASMRDPGSSSDEDSSDSSSSSSSSEEAVRAWKNHRKGPGKKTSARMRRLKSDDRDSKLAARRSVKWDLESQSTPSSRRSSDLLCEGRCDVRQLKSKIKCS